MNRSTIRITMLATLVSFGILTAIALWVDGITGIFGSIARSWGSLQIFADLVIALTLVMVWMFRDAKARGRNLWSWIVATLAVGAFSPLIYLLVRNSVDS